MVSDHTKLFGIAPFGEVFIHSLEDLIVYKLLYFSISLQTKHPRDIAAILRAKAGELEYAYIRAWAQRLGLTAIWEELRQLVESGAPPGSARG
jgi:hypothetical protein